MLHNTISTLVKKNNSLQLFPILISATTVESNIRQYLKMADEIDFQVLRIGYEEEVIKKFIQQQLIKSTSPTTTPTTTNAKPLTTEDFVSYNDSISKTSPLFDLIRNSHSTGTGRISSCTAITRIPFDPKMLRPGGSISGPIMMTIADWSMFAVSFALVGKPLAVTTNLNINFFRKPMAGQELVAEARLIKGGKRLHVFEVDIMAVDKEVLLRIGVEENHGTTKMETTKSDDEDDSITLVAHSTGTYSLG